MANNQNTADQTANKSTDNSVDISNGISAGGGSTARPRTRAGTVRLVAGILLVAFIWLVILPTVARLDSINNYLGWLDSRDIDPSAMFYTDLEMADELLVP